MPVRLIPAQAGKTQPANQSIHARAAHPRAGGENQWSVRAFGLFPGSSPRRRGKPTRKIALTKYPRLIPAQAGKTRQTVNAANAHGAHPRAGGENRVQEHPAVARRGSSPRRRGKRLSNRVLYTAQRLIPAQAGKTLRLRKETPRARAHPRAGGENGREANHPQTVLGSSPRRRGKLRRDLYARLDIGLIPAQAGKTVMSSMTAPGSRAHPRAGGENALSRARPRPVRGSSPRRRGKPRTTTSHHQHHGLIPAQAGKTALSCPHGTRSAAHPRAGGENFAQGIEAPLDLGSSPRRRGKPSRSASGSNVVRLIPAQAGKTPLPCWPPPRPTAHPRAGGENGPVCVRQALALGSSPRRRGKHIIRIKVLTWHRLIPAQAGKT